jgi:hypothetical protein
VNAAGNLERQGISLVHVLLSASTDPDMGNIQVESSFEGRTCLIAGNENTLTEALLGILSSARRSAGASTFCSAHVNADGETVTLTLSEETSGRRWLLQFPELHPDKEN